MLKIKIFTVKESACVLVLFLFVFLAISPACGQEIFALKEQFENLTAWRPLTFPKIAEHSTYEIVEEDSKNTVLKASSDASASGLIWKKSFNVYTFPRLKWRWKVSNIYKKGDATKKSGDDYAARMYVVFEYDSDDAGVWKRAKYKAAKIAFGEYPPDSSLNYIWANKKHQTEIITSPYTESAKLIVLQAGEEKSETWVEQEVNILADYRKAFGEEPPKRASLAIMNDSDNTGESAVSYFDDVVISD